MPRKTSSAAPRARKVAAGGMTPCGDYVLVEVTKADSPGWDTLPGSKILLPETARPEGNILRGVVLALSPHVKASKFGLSVGDVVLVSKFARKEEVGGGRILIHAESVIAAVKGGK